MMVNCLYFKQQWNYLLIFEHISVYTFHPLHASKVLGGEWVGVQYSENHKPYPYARFTSPLSSG